MNWSDSDEDWSGDSVSINPLVKKTKFHLHFTHLQKAPSQGAKDPREQGLRLAQE